MINELNFLNISFSQSIGLRIGFRLLITSSLVGDSFICDLLFIISTSFGWLGSIFRADKDSLKSKSYPKMFWQLSKSSYCLQIGQLVFFLHHESIQSAWKMCLQMVSLTSLSMVMSVRQTEQTCKGILTLEAGTLGMYWSKWSVGLTYFSWMALYLISFIFFLR